MPAHARSHAALLVLALGLPGLLAAQPKAPADIDAVVERARAVFAVPGVAVAIVKDGAVVLARGYGQRTLGRPERVDAQTLFGIASNTKAFTATALALLVEEGRIEWDAPVIRYLPWFRMSDPFVTAELTVRDLLVHRSGLGLGAGDLLWWPATTYDRKEIVRRLRDVPLATSFRSAYAYDNVLYTVAGEVIEAVTGSTWEDFVASRILAPVGMTASTVRHSDAGGGGNVATPHALVEGSVRQVAPFLSDNVNPAGGINANAADMARWLMVQLDSGRVADGRRLFSPRTTRELWALVTPRPDDEPPPELSAQRAGFFGYGLGFGVREYRGRKLLRHGGALPGNYSYTAMIPGLRLGVAVLTNQESDDAIEAIAYHVLDAYLGVPPVDWVDAYRRAGARRDAAFAAADRLREAARDSSSRPSLPIQRYAGTYRDAWYGDITIREEQGRLVLRMVPTPGLVGDVTHWQYDSFLVRWRDREMRADAFITFSLTSAGAIEQAKMRAVSPSTDFSFDFQHLLLRPVTSGEKK